jgi:transcriptional regulator with XRE-family HTH domain
MPYIDPEALSACRARRNLTQQQLADESEVSKKQIGRLEKGTRPTNANDATVERLAQALGVEGAALAKAPNQDDPKKSLPPGYKRAYIYTDDKDRLLYQFLRVRYGVEPRSILSAAPLLFLVVAEWSLAERKERLEALEQVHETLGKTLGKTSDRLASHHLEDVLTGLGRLEDAIGTEQRSLEARDLSGKTFSDDEWSEGYEGAGDLFVDFLAQKVRDLAPDAIDDETWDEISGSLHQIDVSLFNSEIERLTNGDGLAKLALARHVGLADIPADLLGEEKTAERVAWLQAQCSPETRREHKEFRDMVDSVDLESLGY